MFWRALMVLSLAVGVAVCSGCSTQPTLKPKGRVVVAVQKGEDNEPTKVHLLDEVVVHLPPIQTPGNQWTLVANDERYLKQLRQIALGEGGIEQASFLAIHVGRRPIRFFAVVPGQREVVPTQAYEVVIQIEGPS